MSNKKIGFRLWAFGFRDNGRSDSRMPKAECRLFSAVLLLGLVLAASGCVSPSGYFHDRWADAKDVFTATVGVGGGAKARVGPLSAGLFLNSDRAGLRGGEGFHLSDGPLAGGDADGALLLFFSDQFDLRRPPIALAGRSSDRRRYQMAGDDLAERNKSYRCGVIPLPSPLGTFEFPRAPYYYTQVEAAIGVGGTLRLGFNPGELLDFLFGWTTLDIFSDDLTARRERDARKKLGPGPGPEPKPPAAPTEN